MNLRNRMNDAIGMSLNQKVGYEVEKFPIERTLNIDTGINTSITVKQGDHNSRLLKLTLLKTSRVALDLTGTTVYLFVKKPNDDVTRIEGEINSTSVGLVNFSFNKESLSVAGTCSCEVVRVGSDNSTLSFPLFLLKVDESIYKDTMIAIVNDDEFSLIDNVVPINNMN